MANRYFIGEYTKPLDEKNRLRIPDSMQRVIEVQQGDNRGLYIVLGEQPGSLSLYTEPVFDELAARLKTDTLESPEAMEFELEFFTQAHHVTGDAQWRFVLPEQLRTRAGLKEQVVLAGRGRRIDVFEPESYASATAGRKEGWPNWSRFLRMESRNK
ncbi:MAG: Transcriptional regulator MraZ [Phycisphaerae bacterium]|nr:Transcriptional regulator MraZ [Phycisphaerae bacterium]